MIYAITRYTAESGACKVENRREYFACEYGIIPESNLLEITSIL